MHDCNLVINIYSQSSNSLVLGEALAWSFSCKLVRKKMCGNMWKQRAPPNFEGGNAHPSHGYLPRVWWYDKKHNWFLKFRFIYQSTYSIFLLHLLSIASSLGLLFIASSLYSIFSSLYISSLHCIFPSLHLLFIASSLHCIFSSLHLLLIASSLYFTFSSLHCIFIKLNSNCIGSSASSLYSILFPLHLLFIASPMQHLLNASSLQCLYLHSIFSSLQPH